MYDALVIGGGPAGSSTAMMLARSGWRVTLIEKASFPRRKVCGEYMSATNWPLLEKFGVLSQFAAAAGPAVRRVAVFSEDCKVVAPLPISRIRYSMGRALSRDKLDTMLLDRARDLGVEVRQPFSCNELRQLSNGFVVRATNPQTSESIECHTRVVVAAHGSWQPQQSGALTPSNRVKPSDLFGFKAHFENARLEAALMPLLSFDGGYGGMVNCEAGRTSLSCCLRRDRMNQLDRSEGRPAGDAVFEHILQSCPVLNTVVDSARVEGSWLSAGPLRPGIRPAYANGVFNVGNAAGEAHPVIAEGISMALQSGWLVAKYLAEWRVQGADRRALAAVGKEYGRAWRSSFAKRLRFAAAIAQWAMRPSLVTATCRLLACQPRLLTWGAQLSGKTELVVS